MVIIGERGFFSASEYDALCDDADTRPVAHTLTYAFGEATCPQCERRFSVVGQVVARSS
ncbi:hypothetical protein ACFV2X_06665 [Streptomyces sp. NPDC059679]|uniref:hypothetical protein n=1 Tax=Streptomyces sp. NPDC059679 TaxID=3346903 RepID=UPI0036C6A722